LVKGFLKEEEYQNGECEIENKNNLTLIKWINQLYKIVNHGEVALMINQYIIMPTHITSLNFTSNIEVGMY
jgi:hypothetical protein